jgi:hypothetical protein
MSVKKSVTIGVVVPLEVKRILEEVADERTRERRLADMTGKVFASDIVREAIEDWLARNGYEIPVEVDRGGFRVPVSFGNHTIIQHDPVEDSSSEGDKRRKAIAQKIENPNVIKIKADPPKDEDNSKN